MVKYYLIKEQGIAFTLWIKNKIDKSKNYDFMIFLHGLPSHPYQHNPAKLEHFFDKNIILVFPNYIGTWASEGVMSWESCVKTIIRTIDIIKKKSVKTIDNQRLKWDLNRIILVGNSFGGSIALVAGAKSKDINFIISVAAPTNWENHSRFNDEKAEPIEELYYKIKKGWTNLWRIPNMKEWQRLVKGVADINPIDYINILKNKNIFLLHGEKDHVVVSKRSKELFSLLKKGKGHHKLKIIDEEHIGYNAFSDKELSSELFSWLDI
ncbi:prolyl oligopeptidase family serine peptidase [Candidatus Woesearchaeota archaeon]|nr:prolyl oligopeptidase family serine peptidase [Candidatus Woesearchaeota archaeon]